MIGQKRLDTNYKIDLTEWQLNQDSEIDTLHNSVVDIDNRVKELEKGGGGGITITIDSDFSETSENPLQNKVITLEITSLETRVTNLENGGGGVVTGISYRDSVLYSNKTISLVESSTVGDNEVQTTIENAKVIPISVIPMDSSATWRVYFITSWVYDSVSNSTTIKFIATDTSTNVNVVCLPVIENE